MMAWQKVPEKKAPPFLEHRQGRAGTVYRVNYRAKGISLRKVLEGDFRSGWKRAAEVAEKLVSEARFGAKQAAPSLVRSESLCDEIVRLKEPLDPSTFEGTEIGFRVHIKPFLNGVCAYEQEQGPCRFFSYVESGKCPHASELRPTTWLAYKTHFRLHHPKGALFSHFKFFGMLVKYAHEKGILAKPFKLEFDEKKEDHRKAGRVIPDEYFRAFLATANRTWRDRAILQRLSGQRPGVIRGLRKSQVDLETGVVQIEKKDSKNNRAYDFILPPTAVRILRERLEIKRVQASPFFFPKETDHSAPMDKSLNGWHSAWRAAKELLLEQAHQSTDPAIASSKARRAHMIPLHDPKTEQEGYTPHDIRHTFLTEKFRSSKNPALICYQADLSLEEAMKTYIHFKAEDTRVVADDSEASALQLLTESEPATDIA